MNTNSGLLFCKEKIAHILHSLKKNQVPLIVCLIYKYEGNN